MEQITVCLHSYSGPPQNNKSYGAAALFCVFGNYLLRNRKSEVIWKEKGKGKEKGKEKGKGKSKGKDRKKGKGKDKKKDKKKEKR